ncbi:MAG: hypothetical protein WB783_13160 [Arenicellales bacterium]
MWLAEFFNGRYSPEEIKRGERRLEIARFEQEALKMRSEYVAGTISRAGRALAGSAVRLGRTVKALGLRVWEDMERGRRMTQAINELSALDDLALRDIGLVRSGIRSAVYELEERNGTRRRRSTADAAPVAREKAAEAKSTGRGADRAQWDRAA